MVNRLILSTFIECNLIKLPLTLGCRFLVGSGWRHFLNEVSLKVVFFNLLLHFEVEKFPHPVVYISVIPMDVSRVPDT